MPIRSIADIRGSWGADWSDASDEEVLGAYAKAARLDPMQVADQLGYDPGKGSLTRERLSGSADSYQSNLYGVGEAVTGAMGMDSASRWLGGKSRDNKFQADVAGARAKALGGVDSYKDVDGFGSGMNYLGGLAAQSLPYAGEALLGGLGVRALSGGLRAASSAGRAAGATEDLVQAGRAAEKAMSLRGAVGGAAASYPSAVGDILSNQREANPNGPTDLLAAMAGGVPYAALNMFGVSGALGRGNLARNVVDAFDGRRGIAGGLARMGATVARVGAEEGLSEVGQEMLNQGAGRMAVDPNAGLFDPDAVERYKESFVGGAALGGAFGSVGGHRRSANYQRPLPGAPDTSADLLQLGHDTNVRSPNEIISFPDGSAMTRAEYAAIYGDKNPNSTAGPGGPVNMQQQGAIEAMVARGEITPEQASAMGYVTPGNQAFRDATRTGTGLPTQSVIDQNTGVTQQPYAGKDYPAQFNAAADARTGQQVADASNGQVEYNDTDLESVQRQAGILAEEQRLKAATVAAEAKHAANRQAATDGLVDRNPDGSLPVRVNPREITTFTGLTALRAAKTITEDQHADLVGQLREALKANDKKTLGAVAKEVAVLQQPIQGAANVSAPVAPGVPAGGGRVAGGPVAPGSVAVAGRSAAVGNGNPAAAPVVAPAAGPVGAVAAGETGAPAAVIAPKKAARVVPKGTFSGAAPTVVGAPIRSEPAFGTAEYHAQLQAELAALGNTQPGGSKVKPGQGGGTTLPAIMAIYIKMAANHIAMKGRQFAAYLKMIRAAAPGITDAEARLVYSEANKLLKAKAVEVAIDKHSDGQAPLVSFSSNAQGEDTGFTARMSKGPHAVAKFSNGQWVLDPEQSGRRGASPAVLGTTREDALSELPYAVAQADKEVQAAKATAGGTTPSGKRAVKFEPSESAIAGGRLDMDALQRATAHNPKMYKAIRYYLGVDDDGSRMVDDDRITHQAAAEMAEIGANSGAAVSTAMKNLGITKYMASRFMQGSETVRAVEGYVAESDATDAEGKSSIDAMLDIAEEEYQDALAEQRDTVDGVTTSDQGKDELDNQAANNDYDAVGMGSVSSVGGSSSDIDSTKNANLGRSKIYSRIKTAGVANVDLHDLLTFYTLGVRYVLPDGLPANASTVVKNNARDNEAILKAVGDEIEQRVAADRAGALKANQALHLTLQKRGMIQQNSPEKTKERREDVEEGLSYETDGTTTGQITSKAPGRDDRETNGAGEDGLDGRAESRSDGPLDAGDAESGAAAQEQVKFSKFNPSRRRVLVAAIAAAGGPATAGVSLGKAKPLSEVVSQQMSPAIAKILRGNGATNPDGATAVRQAITEIAENGPLELRAFAKMLLPILPKGGFMLTVDDKGLWNAHGAVRMSPIPQLMLFTAEKRTGLTYETFLHETLHLIVASKYASLSSGVFRSNYAKSKTSDPAAIEQLEQFHKVWDEFRLAVSGRDKAANKDLELSISEALRDPDEFFVRALTEPRFQSYLASLEYKGKTLLQRFASWVKESLFGFRRDGTTPSWLDAALAASNDVLTASDRDVANFAVLRAFNSIGRKNSAVGQEDTKFSKAAPDHIQTQNAGSVETTIQKLPAELRPVARVVGQALSYAGRNALNTLNFTEDLLDRAKAGGLKTANTYKELAHQRAAFVGHHERLVQAVTDSYAALPERLKGKGDGTVNQYLMDSTTDSKWGYQPTYFSDKVEIDPERAKQYNALGAEGQQFVDTAFQLGAYTLKLKKETLLANTSSEYDTLIAAADKAGDATGKAGLEADKAKALKQFGSLMSIRETDPYSPRKRYGNFVVMAKSDKYLAAEQEAKRTGSDLELKKLQRNEADYFVDFAESDRLAEALRAELAASGDYSTQPEGVIYRAKETVRHELFGGSGTLAALSKLRAQVDAEYDSRSTEESSKQRETSRKLHEMITDLYLSSLAESSSRKSEMRRRGIAGNLDMVRALETQGKADANFLGAIKYNEATTLALNDMRREVRTGGYKMQREKAEFFNEILARHLQTLEYKPQGLSSKLVNLTSKWFLATNPAYYLQNATQPWMMSLPVMAGRHEMGASAKALYSAYKELAPAFKDAKLFGHVDFDALLADSNKALTGGEKKMIRGLLDSGRIDIGMANELGKFRIEGNSAAGAAWNRVDESLRGLQTKLEALNRVTTALTAYRLELGKTKNETAAYDYADRIIQETHGDYNAWNAPRAFNNEFGKVALQFKKYQLIQLSLMAKLVKNSFGDAPATEKWMARKALMYMFGQALIVGGTRALPVPVALSYALTAMFGDGADEPPEYVLRRQIGNKEIADLLIGGLPSLAGVNASKFGGMGQMLSLLPFTDVDLTSRKGVEAVGFALLGGPLGGLSLRAADGVGYMANGDYYRGLENFLPTGFTNVLKASRLAVEGAHQKDGDVTMSPEEVTLLDTALQAMGLPPERQAQRQLRQSAEHDISRSIQDQSARIKTDYTKALKSQDSDAITDARAEWVKYQDKREKLGFKKSPMSDLLNAPKQAAKREHDTVGNVQYRKSNERFVRELEQL